jgi:aldehyde dehydrogenase (NAD+)
MGTAHGVPAILSSPGLVIGGETVPAISGECFETFDPSIGSVISEVPRGSGADIDLAVRDARAAFEKWRESATPGDRVRLLHAIAAQVRRHHVELEQLDALTAGLPTRMAVGDVETAARYFEYYAGIADKLHGESIPLGPDFIDYTEREPYGVCGAIPPFNVPLQLAARSVAPALATGNAVVVKPAEQAPLLALRLGQLILEAGAPAGLVNVVSGVGPLAGNALVTHAGVDHITFTGSVEVGTLVMRDAAALMTPVTLELGGKSPQIVFADADLDAAAAAICGSALYTAGQVCSAGTRVLVESSVHDGLAQRLTAIADAIRIGPAIEAPDMGPLISRIQRDRVVAAVDWALEQGAVRLTRRSVLDAEAEAGSGFFVPPIVFGAVDRQMDVARNEIFGPVLAMIRVEDEKDAIDVANDSEFGLVAGIWTRDLGRAHRVARRVRAGQIFINNYGVGGGIELPFGGYRRSGIGREKGLAALSEYTQTKNVCVSIAAA